MSGWNRKLELLGLINYWALESYSKLGSFELGILIVGYSSLEEERLGFFVLQLSAPKDNRWCFVLNSSDDMNFECLGLLRMCEIISVFTVKTGKSSLEQISKVYGNQAVVVSIDPRRVYINDPNDVEFKTVRVTNRERERASERRDQRRIEKEKDLIILCSWKSNGGAIDSFTETFGRLMGKVASDKCHKWVFKEPTECEPNISNYWQSSFDVLPTEWTDQFESGIQTIAVIQAGHGLLQLGSCKIGNGCRKRDISFNHENWSHYYERYIFIALLLVVIIIMACYELESQFLYLSFSLVSSLPVESLSVSCQLSIFLLSFAYLTGTPKGQVRMILMANYKWKKTTLFLSRSAANCYR
ncbi:hypothetical protein F8388_022560 [Cannabis sativa]|uniref:Transcription factor MYC/MYB N-terminal domain-containing protein n=1 Tax=Cannabis sativa TaxID=3483 RepID=A0A7J6EK58_CANSA|nr:hypothetical protein F8388_022560 [Cannabis sativa]